MNGLFLAYIDVKWKRKIHISRSDKTFFNCYKFRYKIENLTKNQNLSCYIKHLP